MKANEDLLLTTTEQQYDKYKYDSIQARIKYLRDLFDQYDNLKNIKETLIQIIQKDDIDSYDNKFILYVNGIAKNKEIQPSPQILRFIYNEIERRNIEQKTVENYNSWLYNPSLYTESDKDIAYKVGAFELVDDKSKQRYLSKTISENDLMDGDKIKTKQEIEEFLKTIQTTKDIWDEDEYIIKDAIMTIFKLDKNTIMNKENVYNNLQELIKNSKYKSNFENASIKDTFTSIFDKEDVKNKKYSKFLRQGIEDKNNKEKLIETIYKYLEKIIEDGDISAKMIRGTGDTQPKTTIENKNKTILELVKKYYDKNINQGETIRDIIKKVLDNYIESDNIRKESKPIYQIARNKLIRKNSPEFNELSSKVLLDNGVDNLNKTLVDELKRYVLENKPALIKRYEELKAKKKQETIPQEPQNTENDDGAKVFNIGDYMNNNTED